MHIKKDLLKKKKRTEISYRDPFLPLTPMNLSTQILQQPFLLYVRMSRYFKSLSKFTCQSLGLKLKLDHLKTPNTKTE